MLYGSHYLFAIAPVGAAVVLYVMTVLVLWPMRKLLEGEAYNVANSSRFGDMALCVFIACGGVLLMSGTQMPEWALSFDFHLACASIAAGVGVGVVLFVVPFWRAQIADTYHNLVVISVYLYLIFSMAPVYYHTGWSAVGSGLAILSVWLATLLSDIADNRLEQRAWLKKHDPVKYYVLTSLQGR